MLCMHVSSVRWFEFGFVAPRSLQVACLLIIILEGGGGDDVCAYHVPHAFKVYTITGERR